MSVHKSEYRENNCQIVTLPAGALLVERAASVGEGFSQEAPLVYNFGHLSPASNPTLYNILVSRMAAAIQEKMARNRKGWWLIMNTGKVGGS